MVALARYYPVLLRNWKHRWLPAVSDAEELRSMWQETRKRQDLGNWMSTHLLQGGPDPVVHEVSSRQSRVSDPKLSTSGGFGMAVA